MFATKLLWLPYMLSLLVMYARLISITLFSNKFPVNTETLTVIIPLWPIAILSRAGRKHLSQLFTQ